MNVEECRELIKLPSEELTHLTGVLIAELLRRGQIHFGSETDLEEQSEPSEYFFPVDMWVQDAVLTLYLSRYQEDTRSSTWN
jgi:hypothetical protein